MTQPQTILSIQGLIRNVSSNVLVSSLWVVTDFFFFERVVDVGMIILAQVFGFFGPEEDRTLFC